ncbi:hypothetical protein [Microbacterium oleivorans]|uniref:DUF600 family protein n=1 Tax=Microbacterium oleivorans TaxID=273677 RepID=A0A031FZC4_9MICO|nr:hypothetical protein [Microbacterium oleivorans]AZS44028.1 hypothetical protein BWL13_01606 [Microbacterium oleivorans]EZP29943.1 hypothetical protein BW34_00573 [Microbacterium oleivorans]THE07169.1 hypothetical protein E1I21_08695 [Microbacterium oleivorans]
MTTDPTADLIRAVVTHMIGAADDWKSFSMVISLGGGRLSAVSGFAYSPDGAVSAVTARPSQIMPAVEAYLADRYPDGQALPVKFLVQFDRDVKAYEITFEDSDASRWKVTPANLDAIEAELRPTLG